MADKVLDLKRKIIEQLDQSRKHLEYSYNKVKLFDFLKVNLAEDEEKLETLESNTIWKITSASIKKFLTSAKTC